MTDREEWTSPLADEVEYLSDRIVRQSRWLRVVGLYLVACILMSLAALLWDQAGRGGESTSNSYLVTMYAAVFAIVGVAGSAYWDQVSRRGQAFVESLTDLVQDVPVELAQETSRHWRSAIREFERATDLPLVPGKYGITAYVGVFLVEIILAAVLLR